MTDKPEDKVDHKGAGHRSLVGFGLPPGPFDPRAVPTSEPAAPVSATAPMPLKVPVASNEATLDVAAIRARTGLSQEEFAARYRFSKRTLQEWEQGRKRPTGAARSLLAVIRRHPKKVAKALAKDALGIETTDDESDE
jgi:DNA-binding XRE family transcriptional regulator